MEEVKYRDFRNKMGEYIGREVVITSRGRVLASLIPAGVEQKGICANCGEEGKCKEILLCNKCADEAE